MADETGLTHEFKYSDMVRVKAGSFFEGCRGVLLRGVSDNSKDCFEILVESNGLKIIVPVKDIEKYDKPKQK